MRDGAKLLCDSPLRGQPNREGGNRGKIAKHIIAERQFIR
jgi:hypothetical protein